MENPATPEPMPEDQEGTGGFPVQPAGADGPLPPPKPRKAPLSTLIINTTGVLAAITGGLFILSMAIPGRTMGATRSYRLKCEERQQQIEAAANEDAKQSLGREPGAVETEAEEKAE